MENPYLFDLAKSKPTVTKPGGTVQGAYEKVFPIVAGQKAAMFLVVLKPGAIREPHWHPNAWEFDYCIKGKARMSVVGPNNEWKLFDVEAGQVVFVPMGFFHYFENTGDEDLQFLISFNNSGAESDDDIGVSVSLGGIPNHVLAATFGVPEKVFDQVPKLHEEVLIVSAVLFRIRPLSSRPSAKARAGIHGTSVCGCVRWIPIAAFGGFRMQPAKRLKLPEFQIRLLRVHAAEDRGADLALGADRDRRRRDDLGGACTRHNDDAVAVRDQIILRRDRNRADLDRHVHRVDHPVADDIARRCVARVDRKAHLDQELDIAAAAVDQ